MNRPATLARINRLLKGSGILLVRGEAYSYFVNAPDASPAQAHALGLLASTSVPVPYVRSLSMAQWQYEIDAILSARAKALAEMAEDE